MEGRQKSATPRETKLPSSAFVGDIGANWPPCRALPGPACANPPPRSPSLACNSVQTAKSICLAFLFFLPLRSSSNQSRWEKNSSKMADVNMSSAPAQRSNLRYGMNKGRPTTVIPKTARPSNKKGVKTEKKTFVRSVIREVAGFSPYEKRVMELLRNSKDKKAKKLTKKRLGTLLRSKRKIEELSAVIVEQRRAGH